MSITNINENTEITEYVILGLNDGYSIDADCTLTFLAGFSAFRQQVFFGEGRVRFIQGAATGTAGVPEVYPE